MLDFSKNHFELFGMPVGFVMDREKLVERYRDLQKVVHPDRFANASDQERRISMQGATRVNEAFQTLKDPLARARYLLVLNGIDLDEETTTDTDFLMQQLELREELAEVRTQAEPFVVIADLLSRIDQNINRLIGQIASRFEAGTPTQLEQARELVRKLQFLQKLRAEAQAIEAELDESL